MAAPNFNDLRTMTALAIRLARATDDDEESMKDFLYSSAHVAGDVTTYRPFEAAASWLGSNVQGMKKGKGGFELIDIEGVKAELRARQREEDERLGLLPSSSPALPFFAGVVRQEATIAQSPLYPHGTNYKLRHTEAKASPGSTVTHDDDGEPVAPTTGKGKTYDFEVQLEPRDDGNPNTRLGVDTTSVDFDGQIVKTGWDALTFPKGVGAGSSFELTYNGKKGRLTIGAARPAQHPTEAKVVGAEFVARWEAS